MKKIFSQELILVTIMVLAARVQPLAHQRISHLEFYAHYRYGFVQRRTDP